MKSETYEKDKVKREYNEGLSYLRTKEAHDLENETKVYEAEQKVGRLILITQYTDRIAELRAGYNPYDFLDRNATEAMQREIEKAVLKG